MNAWGGLSSFLAMAGIVFSSSDAVAQTAQVEADLRLKLAELRLQEAQGAGQAKPLPKPSPPPQRVADGPAIARLGDSRLRHAALPLFVIFSQDGKRLYSGGEDGILRVWDTATGNPITAIHFATATLIGAKFTPDNARLAIQQSSGQINFLDAHSLQLVSTFLPCAEPGFAISPDSQFIAAVGVNGKLEVTELASGLVKLELPRSTLVKFHPDGRKLAVVDARGTVTLHMLAGGKPVATIDHGAAVKSIAFRAGGQQLATAGPSPGGTVKVWDIAKPGKPRLVTDIEGANQVDSWIAPDRVAVSDGFNAGVYDVAARKWISRVKGPSGPWTISADGRVIAATGTGGHRVRMWDVASGKQLHAENDTFPNPALLIPSADGKWVFLLSGDTAYRWDVSRRTATPVATLPGTAIVAADGGGRLAVATTQEVCIYDGFDPAKPLPPKPSRVLTEHAAACRSIAVSADGTKVAYSGSSAKTVIADAASGKTIRVLPVSTVGLAVAFTPDSLNLVMVGRDGFLRLWSVTATGKNGDGEAWKLRVQRGQKGAIAISPDGKLIAASSSGLVKVVNQEGMEIFSVGNLFDYGLLMDAAFSRDGRLLLTATEGPTGGVQVREVATRTLVAEFKTGFGTVRSLALSADGTRLVSSGAEEAITVWDLTGRHGKEAPTAGELLSAWAELASLEGSRGVPAVHTLVAGGAKSTLVIAAGMEEIQHTRVKIADWTAKLGSDDFAEREAATTELTALGIRALPALQTASVKSDSPEARSRAKVIIGRITSRGIQIPRHGLSGDTLQLFRAVEVLEKVGDMEARSLLHRIALMDDRVAEAANAALKRLGDE